MKSSGSTSMKQSTIFGLSQPAHESSLAADMTKPQQKGRDRSMVWEFLVNIRLILQWPDVTSVMKKKRKKQGICLLHFAKMTHNTSHGT